MRNISKLVPEGYSSKQQISDILRASVIATAFSGYLYSAQRKWRNGENNRLGLRLG